MGLYLKHLASKLDKERPEWRRKTIILMDGASYHQDAETLSVLEEFRIPVMFLGPHSYDAAPIETFFSWVKRVNLNPEAVP